MDNFSLDDVRGYFRQDMQAFLRQVGEAAQAIERSARLTQPPVLVGKRRQLLVSALSAACAEIARGVVPAGTADSILLGMCELVRAAETASEDLSPALSAIRGHARIVSEARGLLQEVLEAELAAREPDAQAAFRALEERLRGHDDLIEAGRGYDRFVASVAEADAPRVHAPEWSVPEDLRAKAAAPFAASVDRIVQASKRIVQKTSAFEPGPVRADEEPARFFAVRDWSHAMHGSSALIGLQRLAGPCRSLEYFACGAGLAAETLFARVRKIRAIARLLQAGAQAVCAAQALETGGQTDRAAGLAGEFLAEVLALEARFTPPPRESNGSGETATAGAAEPGGDSFANPAGGAIADAAGGAIADAAGGAFADAAGGAFADAAGGSGEPAFDFQTIDPLPLELEPAAAPGVFEPNFAELAAFEGGSTGGQRRDAVPAAALGEEATLDVELLEIFQEEARQATEPLQSHLQTLARDHSRSDVLKSLERLFHTLKGSSATVGLARISALSAGLEDMVEAVLEKLAGGEARVANNFVTELVARTNELLQLSGLMQVAVEGGAGDASHGAGLEGDPELSRIFTGEALAICSELGTLADRLGRLAASDEDAVQSVLAAARLFHKLKGSAVLGEARGIAATAQRLQASCESMPPEPDLAGRIAAAVEEIRAQLSSMARAGEPELSDAGSVVSTYSQTETVAEPARPFQGRREPVEVESDAVWEAFVIESQETLEAMDRDVVQLETSVQPKEVLRSLFRSYHTLKGALNTVGLGAVGRLLHMVEDFLESCSNAAVLPPLANVGRLLFRVQQSVRDNLTEARRGFVEVWPERLQADLEAVRQGRASVSRTELASTAGAGQRSDRSAQGASAGDERSRGTGKPSSTEDKSPSKHATKKGDAEKRTIRVAAERLENLMNLTGELVVDRSRLSRRVAVLAHLQRDLVASRRRLLSTVEAFREQYEFSNVGAHKSLRHEARAETRELVGAASGGSTAARRGGAGRGGAGRSSGASYEGVFSDLELDQYEDINILARTLAEITSDITEVQTQIEGVLDTLSEDADHFDTTVSDMQSEIMRARMVPLDQLFIRMHSPVRDAADREGRDVRIVTSGEGVTLDKTIIDELYTPLLHLVRNAVSHGIETAEARRAAHKPAQGTVTLRARADSGQIVLQVIDDGAGLDLPAIHRRGIEMGLIPADTLIESPAVKELIFAAGLSSKQSASEVSGRGIGCDVVRREIERLNGQIEVETERGVGTTFTIILPLTLAIYRALVVESSRQRFALPLNLCELILDLSEVQLIESGGVRRISHRGTFVALDDLEKTLDLTRIAEEGDAGRGSAVMVRMGESRLALRVDRIVGQEEIVVKSMGDLLQDHPMFSGVTISGDGDLILILDLPGLLGDHKRRTSVRGEGARRPELRDTQAGSVPGPAGESRALRVLYIDDSLSVRKAAEKLLKNLGVDVTLAVDGMDGLEKVRQSTFDLVFTDLEMPRLNGYDMVRELRFVPNFKNVPVVVVTSRSGEKHRQQAVVVGATDYVTKPFNQDILEQQLVKWTRHRAGSSGGQGR